MAFIYDLTDTWNAGGTTFNAIKMNVTDTASAAASKLITVQVGGSEKFSVKKDGVGYFAGNVGIGTTSPAFSSGSGLEVSRSSATATLRLQREGTSPSSMELRSGPNTGEIVVTSNSPLLFSTNGSERARIDNSGNLLVGTTTADNRLTVSSSSSGAAAGVLTVANPNDATNTAADFDFVTHSSGTLATGRIRGFVAGADNYPMSFWTYGSGGLSERMRLDNSGNLLVGTTSTALSTTGMYIEPLGRINIGATGSSTYLGFYISGTLIGSISGSGSTTSYNTSSDYRLKDIDGPIANSGAYIDALNPVQGSWKSDGGRFIGLLAHEVQEVSETTIATGEKDGEEMQAMDYSSPEIITNLIAEIQSLRARVAQLEG